MDIKDKMPARSSLLARVSFGLRISTLLICSTAACSSSTGLSRADVGGGYTLELVDGTPLPVPFETGACPREIHTGHLDLVPHATEMNPYYVILVFLRSQCDPTRVLPADSAEAVREAGEWMIFNSSVLFSSDMKRGTYAAPIEKQAAGELGPVLTLQFDGRRYTFRRTQLP